MIRISVDFSKNRFSDTELYTFSAVILSRMTNNPHFEQTIPPLDTVSAARDAYYAALIQSKEGSKLDTAVKKSKRAALEAVLKQLAMYVQLICNGDAVKIATTGFVVAKKNSIITSLPVPNGLVVTAGPNSGTLSVKCNTVATARYYEFRYCELLPTGERFWHTIVSTKSKTTLEGLTPGKEYTVQVLVSTAKTKSGWSNEVRRYVC
jgi:hypothetical protein